MDRRLVFDSIALLIEALEMHDEHFGRIQDELICLIADRLDSACTTFVFDPASEVVVYAVGRRFADGEMQRGNGLERV